MIDLIEPVTSAYKVIARQKLKLIKSIVKGDLANVASNKPAAAAPGRHDEIGEANADFGDQAPDQITGLAQALAFYRAVLALVAPVLVPAAQTVRSVSKRVNKMYELKAYAKAAFQFNGMRLFILSLESHWTIG